MIAIYMITVGIHMKTPPRTQSLLVTAYAQSVRHLDTSSKWWIYMKFTFFFSFLRSN